MPEWDMRNGAADAQQKGRIGVISQKLPLDTKWYRMCCCVATIAILIPVSVDTHDPGSKVRFT